MNTPGQAPDQKKGTPLAPQQWRLWIWYALFMLGSLWFWQEGVERATVRTVPYSEFKAMLARGEVTECAIQADSVVGKAQPKATNSPAAATAEPAASPTPAPSASPATSPAAAPAAPAAYTFRTVRVEDPDLVGELQKAGVKFAGQRPGVLSQLLGAWVFPLLILFVLGRFLAGRVGNMGKALAGFGSSTAKLVADQDTGVTFADVAGCDEAKFELQEVVAFLKDNARFKALGAMLPKGVLLVGPPGTGKTLLARAVAGEAKVPFFLISGSDFVQMFVGVGAARVRDLFTQAKAKAPCIIFIDELDAVARQRGVQMGAVNDEREQTLNALLVGMDGFEGNEGVIVLAATNRPEVLDRALLRPGRFDRQVVVDAPDLDGRVAILKLHVRGKPLAERLNLRHVARQTPGFSGADLANLVNEAALLAARRDAKEITEADLENAVEKVVAGPERKSRRLGEEARRRVAYHETGHALVAVHSQHADAVHKISIIPHGRAALGYTMQLPQEDQFLINQSELVDRIKGMLGGRAAEQVVFGEVSTGAENDLERATALARQMVCFYGMSETLGLAHTGQRQGMFLPGGADGQMAMQRDCSEATAREIDEEVKRILADAYGQAEAILREHREQLDHVSAELLARETLDAAAFRQLVGLPPEPPQGDPLPTLPEVGGLQGGEPVLSPPQSL